MVEKISYIFVGGSACLIMYGAHVCAVELPARRLCALGDTNDDNSLFSLQPPPVIWVVVYFIRYHAIYSTRIDIGPLVNVIYWLKIMFRRGIRTNVDVIQFTTWSWNMFYFKYVNISCKLFFLNHRLMFSLRSNFTCLNDSYLLGEI